MYTVNPFYNTFIANKFTDPLTARRVMMVVALVNYINNRNGLHDLLQMHAQLVQPYQCVNNDKFSNFTLE